MVDRTNLSSGYSTNSGRYGIGVIPPPSGPPVVVPTNLGNVIRPLPTGFFNTPVVPRPPSSPQPIATVPTSVVGTVPVTYTFAYDFAGRPVTASYVEAGATVLHESVSYLPPPIEIYFGAGTAGPAVPGSVRFVFRGLTYVDRAGKLYHSINASTNAGTLAGIYDYSRNLAHLTDYGPGASNSVTVVSLLTRYDEQGVTSVFFRTPGAPLRPGSFTIRGTTMEGVELSGVADIDGVITGTGLTGLVDFTNGVVRVAFGQSVVAAGHETDDWYDAANVDVSGNIWQPTGVDPSTVFFGTVLYSSIPVDPDIIGLDPVRLPNDGRVVAFSPGDVCVVHNTVEHNVASAPAAASVLDFGRTQVSLVEVFDADLTPVLDTWYTVDNAAGTLTWADPLNLSAYTFPITVRERIEFFSAIANVQITGEITLAAQLPRDFPAAGTMVSSAIAYGNLQGRYLNLFDQDTYSPGVWSDVVSGAPAAASYNDVTYPLLVTNEGAIDERWALRFLSPTSVQVIGETTGIVGTFSTTTDIAPINPVSQTVDNPTGVPYFFIDALGFGSGWAANNVIRFNTIAASKPLWCARTVRQGALTVSPDRVRLQVYGNASS